MISRQVIRADARAGLSPSIARWELRRRAFGAFRGVSAGWSGLRWHADQTCIRLAADAGEVGLHLFADRLFVPRGDGNRVFCRLR